MYLPLHVLLLLNFVGIFFPHFQMAVKNTFGADAISAQIQHIRGSALRELTTTTFVAAVGKAPGLTHGCLVELDLRRPALRAASAAAAKSAQIKVNSFIVKRHGVASGLCFDIIFILSHLFLCALEMA